MVEVSTPGFKLYSTTSNRRGLDKTELSQALNMIWSGNRVLTRPGSSLYKNNSQSNWGRIARKKDFRKLGDNFYYVVVVLTSGRVFYIRSDDANFGTASATWTELNNNLGATPALNANALRYSIYGFNNRLYFADSGNRYFSWDGTTANLVLETNPPNLSSNNIVDLKDKSSRLVALDDGGRTHLSAVNNGQDFTLVSGAGSLSYGRTEGLRATAMCPFNDDLIISTEDNLTLKYQTYRLLGIQFFDPAVPNTDTNQFEVRKVNTIAGIIGESGQEIADDTIGLTLRGVISLNKAINADDLTERDYISFPIKEIIQQINFNKADKIYSTVDYVNGRYLLAVPFGEDTQEANLLLVYDFIRSSPAESIYRWTIWAFAYGDIASLSTIAGVPYISDTSGNIYKLNSTEANFADNGLPINYAVRFAPAGGSEIGVKKSFGDLTLLFSNINSDFEINIGYALDGKYIEDPDLNKPFKIDQALTALRYDTPGIFYDDFNYYDSGSDERVVTLSNGFTGESMEWSFSTNTTGVSWGVSSYSVELESNGKYQGEATNNSQF